MSHTVYPQGQACLDLFSLHSQAGEVQASTSPSGTNCAVLCLTMPECSIAKKPWQLSLQIQPQPALKAAGGNSNPFPNGALFALPDSRRGRGARGMSVHRYLSCQSFLLFCASCSRNSMHLTCPDYLYLPCSSQKSPAKKLTNALSKSLSCASSREPLHPMFPDQPEKPLNLAHIV